MFIKIESKFTGQNNWQNSQKSDAAPMGYDTVLSAGICDTCSIPKMMNTGDGINEPFVPILYCDKMKREICPEPPEDRMVECRFYTCR
jgi:hypothetical protein